MIQILRLSVMAAALCVSAASFAAETVDTDASNDTQVLRVGGDYLVKKITQRPGGGFVIDFAAKVPSGKFDTLRLESDHVHVSVQEGQTLRISAEIAEVRNDVASVSQVLIFVPNVGGPVPVWLLSSRGSPMDLRGSKYLEMHNPLSDFTIF